MMHGRRSSPREPMQEAGGPMATPAEAPCSAVARRVWSGRCGGNGRIVTSAPTMTNVLALPVAYVPSHATTSLFSSLRQRRPPSEDDWPHNEFDFEPYVKRELQIRLESDDEVCPRFERHRRCELGGRCTLRHCVTPSPHVPALLGREGSRRTVCKHWLRSLCKKGDLCDYLHEYDLRRMPECRFYSTFGYCHSGDECLHVHIEPEVKRRRCERYARGFCELGMLPALTQAPSAPRNMCGASRARTTSLAFARWGRSATLASAYTRLTQHQGADSHARVARRDAPTHAPAAVDGRGIRWRPRHPGGANGSSHWTCDRASQALGRCG